MRNLEIEDHIWDFESVRHQLQPCPLDSVLEKYAQAVLGGAYDLNLNEKSTTAITYTAMHGVGTPYVQDFYRQFKFKVSSFSRYITQGILCTYNVRSIRLCTSTSTRYNSL